LNEEIPDNSGKKKSTDDNEEEEESLAPEDETIFNDTSFKAYDKLFD